MLLRKITPEAMDIIEKWCQNTDANFLKQWTGDKYIYPISKEQIQTRLSQGAHIFQFETDGKIIGTGEIIRENLDDHTAHIGCFLIDPQLHYNGLGTEAMKVMLDYCKKKGYNGATLSVYEQNKAAFKCYKRVGFISFGSKYWGDWLAYNMRIIFNKTRT